jgi:hypothetical protein
MKGRPALFAAIARKPDRPWMTSAALGLGFLLIARSVAGILETRESSVSAAEQARMKAAADAETQRGIDLLRARFVLAQQAFAHQDPSRAFWLISTLQDDLDVEEEGLGPLPSSWSPESPIGACVALRDDLRALKKALQTRIDLADDARSV